MKTVLIVVLALAAGVAAGLAVASRDEIDRYRDINRM